MKTRTSDNWKSKPGNFDAGTNISVYTPDTTDLGYPLIFNDERIVDPPTALITYPRKTPKLVEAFHFFQDDYRFATVWTYHTRTVKSVARRTTLTPDFSLYRDSPLPVQQWNHYRKQWCGSYWQYCGAKVIPTVSWSDQRSFDFCFEGIQPGCMVALTVIGLRRYPQTFTKGFDKMIELIHPRTILCLGDITRVYRGEHPLDNIVEYKFIAKKDRYPMVEPTHQDPSDPQASAQI
jgi:hypothetical protein